MVELYQQQAISPVACLENQAYSAVTGVIGYRPNDSPVKGVFSFLLLIIYMHVPEVGAFDHLV